MCLASHYLATRCLIGRLAPQSRTAQHQDTVFSRLRNHECELSCRRLTVTDFRIGDSLISPIFNTISNVARHLDKLLSRVCRSMTAVEVSRNPMEELMRLTIIFCSILMIMTGCGSSRPELYPNEQMRRVGGERAEHDIDDCIEQAKRSRTEIDKGALEPAEKGLLGGSTLSEAQKVFVNKCLRDKGYEPLTWD